MHSNHAPAKRTLKLAMFLPALALCTDAAEALGLGELTVRSRLGAFFQAEVRLIESAGDTRLAGECFRLSGSGDSDSGIPLLTRGRISLERQNGQSKLIITSDQTINEPVLQINLRASCGSEVVRSYTALIDPVSSQQLAGQTSISLPQANKSPAPEMPTPSPASGKSYPRVWQTAQDESAQSISRALFPRQPSAQRRFLAALQAENLQVDLGVNGETPLDAGTALNVPDTRRRAPSPPAVDVGRPAPKEATPGGFPAPVRREKAAVQQPAGRMADRLVISGDADEGSPGNEASLRLSTELPTRLSAKVSENRRALLRIEYKLLSALYVQAEQQLAMAEQVRNLEASFEEMRIATENTARQTGAAMASVSTLKTGVPAETPVADSPAATPVTPSAPTATVLEPSTPKLEESSSWWMEIMIVLGLIGALALAFSRRSGKQEAVALPVVTDKPLYIPPPAINPDKHDPWAAEDAREALHQEKTPSIVPDIVLDEGPPPAPGVINYVKQELPVKHMEVDETGDYSTVIELADIMVCFGRIRGATQALEEFLARDPDTALVPWLKLLEIYRMNDMREEFEACSIKLRTHFNVAPASWELAGEFLTEPIAPVDEKDLSIEKLLQKLPTIGTIPHIKENIQNSWNSPDGLTYLKHLLRDTRDGKRSGFPLAIARELQFLLELLGTRFQHKA